MDVAIIGAGVSGLAAAYFLSKAGHHAHVFESRRQVGGNMLTATVQMGAVERWADLGVNDFNAVTYTALKPLLDEFGVAYLPLEDSTAFSTLDGSYAYTMEGKFGTTMPAALQAAFNRFEREAFGDSQKREYADYTVEQYLQAKHYPPEFARYNLYPRINGMYFVHSTGPASMSFRAIMHYYGLQEGFGGPPPERKYFVGGTQNWLHALESKAIEQGATLRRHIPVTVSASNERALVHTPAGDETFDAVLFACHADEVARILRQGMTQDMLNVLGTVQYENSFAVAHEYAALLPPNRNAWRTYNILIHDNDASLRPYTISYVCNRHQNDAQNPEYNFYGGAEYFVTLNPARSIPDQYVLRSANGARAVSYFPHNIVTNELLNAQKVLHDTVQGQNGVFFTGGWTKGAGLQQECLLSAEFAVKRMLDTGYQDPHTYASEAAVEGYSPLYLHQARDDV